MHRCYRYHFSVFGLSRFGWHVWHCWYAHETSNWLNVNWPRFRRWTHPMSTLNIRRNSIRADMVSELFTNFCDCFPPRLYHPLLFETVTRRPPVSSESHGRIFESPLLFARGDWTSRWCLLFNTFFFLMCMRVCSHLVYAFSRQFIGWKNCHPDFRYVSISPPPT